MGVCCGKEKMPKLNTQVQRPQEQPQQLCGKDVEFEELSGEIKEILNAYINHEKNSPSHKNLAESSHMKHSLEQPNTPYFQMKGDSEDQFQFQKLSKQDENIRLPHKNSEQLPAVLEETDQLKKSPPVNGTMSKSPTFRCKCPICKDCHLWYHTCSSELILTDNGIILCLKCNQQENILDYEFECQQNSSKFKFTAEQLQGINA